MYHVCCILNCYYGRHAQSCYAKCSFTLLAYKWENELNFKPQYIDLRICYNVNILITLCTACIHLNSLFQTLLFCSSCSFDLRLVPLFCPTFLSHFTLFILVVLNTPNFQSSICFSLTRFYPLFQSLITKLTDKHLRVSEENTCGNGFVHFWQSTNKLFNLACSFFAIEGAEEICDHTSQITWILTEKKHSHYRKSQKQQRTDNSFFTKVFPTMQTRFTVRNFLLFKGVLQWPKSLFRN